jgi:hypothetical protein
VVLPSPGERVVVEYFKWPDRNGTSYKGADMDFLGCDDHGAWLWSPRPTARHAGVGYDSFLTLIPVGQWWSATWIRNEGLVEKVWVDITTPAEWIGGAVRMIDLDVDVEQLASGTITVHDEAEFARRTVEWTYPHEVVAAVSTAIVSVTTALRDGLEPFGSVAASWLTRALLCRDRSG